MKPVAAPVNIADRLSDLAVSRGTSAAVVQNGRSVTFRDLEDDCAALAEGLARIGIGPGTRTVLMVPPSPASFALTFALFRVGAVPVLVDPGMGSANLGRCLDEAEPEAFIGTPKAHAARLLKGWGRRTVKRLVTVGRRWLWGGETLESLRGLAGGLGGGHHFSGVPSDSTKTVSPPLAPPAAGATAAILFTSGSTGVPKGAVYTHEIFSAQVGMLETLFDIKPGEVSVPTFPLFALFDVALGLTAVLPDMDFTRPGAVDPREVIAAVRDHGAAQLFGSPALLDRVGRYAQARGIRLPSLRRVLSAGAPVPARVVEIFASLLGPGAEIYTPYGATEALPVCVISGSEILSETAALSREGKGVCVGRPAPGVEVRLIRVSDGPIGAWGESLRVPEGEVGEIVAGGPVVTRGYFNRPEADDLSKISEGGTILHRMGDLGRLDEQGRLWFYGRKSQRVHTALGTLYTIPCEGVFNAHPQVRRTALVGVGSPPKQEPVLCVELETGGPAPDLDRLRSELAELGSRHAVTRGIRTFLFHDGFPVDTRHNAKIFREKLAVWASGKPGGRS